MQAVERPKVQNTAWHRWSIFKKGSQLLGTQKCGKTTLMKLFRHITPRQRAYKIIPSQNTVFSFNHLGFKTIEDYGNEGSYCYEDLGVEPTGRHFGKDCNVIGEILLSRYDAFSNPEPSHRIKTHLTKNISVSEIAQFYGKGIRSRLREFFSR